LNVTGKIGKRDTGMDLICRSASDKLVTDFGLGGCLILKRGYRHSTRRKKCTSSQLPSLSIMVKKPVIMKY